MMARYHSGTIGDLEGPRVPLKNLLHVVTTDADEGCRAWRGFPARIGLGPFEKVQLLLPGESARPVSSRASQPPNSSYKNSTVGSSDIQSFDMRTLFLRRQVELCSKA